MKKKVVSLLLCASMMATMFAGCGGEEKKNTGNKVNQTTESEEGKDEEESVNSEPVHISVASYFWAPVDSTKDTITPEVEKRLLEEHGINVELEPVYLEYANYDELLSTRLAGGTAPDIFLCNGAKNLDTYYDQGVIKTWSMEFFQENAPDIYEFIMNGGPRGEYKDWLDGWEKLSTYDGEMAVIGHIKPDAAMPFRQLIYRGDWLDALGVTEDKLPKTVDEFVDLMYRFAKEDPDGNGKDDTYGCSVTSLRALFGAYGMEPNFMGGEAYWNEDDGKIVNVDVSDNAKEVIKLINKMYKDGIIDPEFVTGTESIAGTYWALSNGFVNARYGVSALAGIDHYRLKGIAGESDEGGPCAQEYWAVNGEDAKFVYGPWIAGPEGEYGYGINIPLDITECAVYNAEMDDEKLAVIFRILNAFATDNDLYMLAAFGIEGENYTMNEDGSVNVIGDGASRNEVGVAALRSLYGPDRAYSQFANDVNFYNNPSIKDRLENWLSKDQFKSYRTNAVYETLPSQSTLSSELITYRDETWVKMITGELDPEADWEAYVTEYMELGGQTMLDEANEWYEVNK